MQFAGRRVSRFTLTFLVLGAAFNIILLGVFPQYRGLLSLLGIGEFVPPQMFAMTMNPFTGFLALPTVISATALAAVGLGLLYLSTRFDFVAEHDDPVRSGEWASLFGMVFGVCWACFLAVEFFRFGATYNNGDSIVRLLSYLLMFVAVIPALFVSHFYVFFCTSIFCAGLVTLPRSALALLRRHRLSDAWASARQTGVVDPDQVISSFGDRTATGAEARKLQRDAGALLAQVQREVAELRAVRDELRAGGRARADTAALQEKTVRIADRLATLRSGCRPS